MIRMMMLSRARHISRTGYGVDTRELVRLRLPTTWAGCWECQIMEQRHVVSGVILILSCGLDFTTGPTRLGATQMSFVLSC
jgi:hypothetical protein